MGTFRIGYFEVIVFETNLSTVSLELERGESGADFPIGTLELHLIVSDSSGTEIGDVIGTIKPGTLNIIQFISLEIFTGLIVF